MLYYWDYFINSINSTFYPVVELGDVLSTKRTLCFAKSHYRVLNLFVNTHPARYSPVKGRSNINIVIPVPSGVIIAEKIVKNKIIYRHLLCQKAPSTTPKKESKIINKGRRNIIPMANIKLTMELINSSTPKKGVAPIAVAYGKSILKERGITKKYAKRQPTKKSTLEGKIDFNTAFFSFSRRAGERYFITL